MTLYRSRDCLSGEQVKKETINFLVSSYFLKSLLNMMKMAESSLNG